MPSCQLYHYLIITFVDFRFLFVSSDLLEVELPSMDGNKNGSINANNNQNTLNRNDTSPMSGSSSSSSLTSLVPSEMVTRASIRAERKLRQKASSDIYYFPSPSDKGKYPVGTSYQVDDRGSASKETMMTERDSLRVLIRFVWACVYFYFICLFLCVF